ELVDVAAVRGGPRAPLVAVDGAELAVLGSPLVPDVHAALLQRARVVLAAQEPQQLLDDAAEEDPLRRDEREAGPQVEPQLVAEHAARARAGAVGLRRAVLEHVTQEVLVGGRDGGGAGRGAHGAMVSRGPLPRCRTGQRPVV